MWSEFLKTGTNCTPNGVQSPRDKFKSKNVLFGDIPIGEKSFLKSKSSIVGWVSDKNNMLMTKQSGAFQSRMDQSASCSLPAMLGSHGEW